MSIKTCLESGTAIDYSDQYSRKLPKGAKGSLYADDQYKRHVLCAFCGRDLKVTSAGYGGASGSVPRHNDPRSIKKQLDIGDSNARQSAFYRSRQ